MAEAGGGVGLVGREGEEGGEDGGEGRCRGEGELEGDEIGQVGGGREAVAEK